MHVGVGNRLGPYEIVSLLAEGGMGRVYLGRDTRLNRRVAIKLIVSDLAANANARMRFEREARTVAALTHPRICSLYDIGSTDGFDYLVMEHLEGETLQARLERSPLPLQEALDRAIEVAEGLDAAHRAGIVHRDLKPANVMLTKSGAKLLDFGIAALQSPDRSPSPETATREATLVTAPGTLLGTPQYMAPEQLVGGVADHRTDIFAFGAVLYEMLTGRRAFEGTGPALAAAILRDDSAPVSTTVPSTPALDRVVARCLAKNREHRWQTMADLLAELRWIRELLLLTPGAPASGRDAAPPGRRTGVRPVLLWSLVGVLAVAALLPVFRRSTAPVNAPPDSRVIRFTVPVEPPTAFSFGGALGSRVAITADGRRLVYVADDAEGSRIYVRAFESLQALPLAGTLHATSVFVSPDGEWVGFFTVGKLKKARVSGGQVVTICDAVSGVGASWGADDVIVFAPSASSPLFRVPSNGGTPERVTTLAEGETSHRWPEILPGGALLFAAAGGPDFTGSRVFMQSMRSGQRVQLTDGTYPRYTATGHLVFARDNSLLAARLDLDSMKLESSPVSVVEDLAMNSTTGAALFTVSRTGALVYRPRVEGFARREMMWVTRDGKEELITPDRRAYLQPRLSPDGRRIAVSVGEVAPERDVWIYDLQRKTLDRLTFETGEDETPVWSPDGRHIAISAARAHRPRIIYTIGVADGAGPTEIATTNAITHLGSWAPTGGALVWTEFEAAAGDIRLFSPGAPGSVRTLVSGPFDERGPALSPDGKWLAYASNETGRSEVFVRPVDGTGGKAMISNGGGAQPAWSATGGELYYRGPTHVMSVAIAAGLNFSPGRQERLFVDRYDREHRDDRNYDVARDGRFLMLKSQSTTGAALLNVVLNWFTELQQRAD